MKFRELNIGPNATNAEGLLFFAQLIDELLFDYSLDTYKPSAMNTSLLCREALAVISAADKGLIDVANLKPILAELAANLSNDEVASSLLSYDIDNLKALFRDTGQKAKEIRPLLELLQAELDLNRYKPENERLLVDAVGDGRGKNRIRALTRSYITTLVNLGFHPTYLYSETLNFFYWSGRQFSISKDLEGYFSLFPSQKREYIVFIKASKLFSEISAASEQLDVRISPDGGEYRDRLTEIEFTTDAEYPCIVAVSEVEASDVFSARQNAEETIELLGTLANLFYHKGNPSWNSQFAVLDRTNQRLRYVNTSLNPMLKCVDMRPEKASRELNEFIGGFTLFDDSLRKFTRSSELHGLALSSDSIENQLLNLWIAVESLIPRFKGSKPLNWMSRCAHPMIG